MKKKLLTKIIPIRLPEAIVKKIDQIAEKRYKTRSTLIREWIEQGIKEDER